MQKMLQDNGWREPPESILVSLLDSDVRKFAILRNPLKRWVSGFAECFMDMPDILNMLDNPTFIEILKRSPVFDNHTELQSAFVPNARNLEYIYLDSTRDPRQFFGTVHTWFERNGYKSDCRGWRDPVNPFTNDETKQAINRKLWKIIETDRDLELFIENFFMPDVELQNVARHIKYEL